jgi:hypothetical protein
MDFPVCHIGDLDAACDSQKPTPIRYQLVPLGASG